MAVTVALMVAVTMLISCGTATAKAPPHDSAYVALGESFTAQSGNPEYNRQPCERAPGTYPTLVAQALHLDLTNVACSGADSADLLTQTQTGSAGPQVMQVGSHTRLVTILIGLDDLGVSPYRFITELAACEAGNSTRAVERTCQTLPDMSAAPLEAQVSAAGTNLAAALAWLHSHRPRTEVYVLDYPAVVGTPACSVNEYLVPADAVLYRSVLAQLNRVLAADASAAHVAFVNLYRPSLTSGGCPNWLTPPTATTVFPLHPSASGLKGMAATVERAVRRGEGPSKEHSSPSAG
jgi:hypothetical protein